MENHWLKTFKNLINNFKYKLHKSHQLIAQLVKKKPTCASEGILYLSEKRNVNKSVFTMHVTNFSFTLKPTIHPYFKLYSTFDTKKET